MSSARFADFTFKFKITKGIGFANNSTGEGFVMDINFNYLNTEQLAELYMKADKELEKALINGADWEEIMDKRRIVTELAIELHKKRRPEDFGNTPADTPFRKK